MRLFTRASIVASAAVAIAIAAACGGSTDSSGTSSSSGTGSSGGSSGASSSGTASGSSSGASGSSSGGVDGSIPGPYDQCDAPSDCAWGEINKEIQSKSDCMCLFGCPYIPLSKTTVERRQAQYSSLCTPGTNGQGQPCPVDDCVPLKDITCIDHKCQAGSPDAGDGG